MTRLESHASGTPLPAWNLVTKITRRPSRPRTQAHRPQLLLLPNPSPASQASCPWLTPPFHGAQWTVIVFHILSIPHMLKQSTGGKTASRCPTGKREKTLLPSLPDFTGPSPSVPPWNLSPLKPSLSSPSWLFRSPLQGCQHSQLKYPVLIMKYPKFSPLKYPEKS